MVNTEPVRVERTIESFNDETNHQFVLEVDGQVVGFVKVCESSENENCGEIQALYILDEYKGQGYGKKLVDIGIQELKNMGYKNMVIGCLEGNPSNDFYTHIGGKFLEQRTFSLPVQEINENVYYYDISDS